MGAASIAVRIMTSISWILLARLLEPSDFGIVALAMLVFSTANLFSSLGMDGAIVHSRLENSRIAFPAFLVSTVTSFLLFGLVMIMPTTWASILGTTEVIPAIRVLSALIFLDVLVIVPRSLLRREMLFRPLGRAKIVSEVANIGVALSLAYLGYGLWSLVYGKLASAITMTVILWIAYPGWEWVVPTRFAWEDLKSLLKFGIHYTASGILSFFNSSWDYWMVGRVLGSAAIGFYSKAFNFTNNMIAGFNEEVISGVLFPSYASIQDEKERLLRAYIKSLSIVALILTPLSLGILVTAAEMVPVLLGQKWLPIVPALQILAVMAFIRPLSASSSPLFQAVGRPDFDARAGLVLTIVMVPLVFVLLDMGIVGVAIAVTAAQFVGYGFNIFQLNRILPGSPSKVIMAIMPAIISSGVMMVGVMLSKAPLRQVVGGEHNLISLALMVAIGAGLYILSVLLMQRDLILETLNLGISVVKSRKPAVVE